MVRSVLRGILSEQGFEVLEAEDGKEALERTRVVGSVDLMLVDWHMPVMNGIELVYAVRAEESFSGAMLMMVTTQHEEGDVEAALEAGAADYILKPFTKEAILEKLTILGLEVAR
jgi:two-component system chemotaxis response regulator CheY